MMQTPYDVLEISPEASNDEIKKAYRRLSRIYHPDANINNPQKEKQEEKFKEVQEAYNRIMEEKEHGGTQGGFYGSYGGNRGSTQYEDRESMEMNAVCNYLNARCYKEALQALSGIFNHDAKWHYYSAIANMGVGNNVNAINLAREAHKMEPNNLEYASFLDQLESGGEWYRNVGNEYGRPTMNMGGFCWKIICANIACNCCFRPI